jgi:uncharacterized protein with PIN domain
MIYGFVFLIYTIKNNFKVMSSKYKPWKEEEISFMKENYEEFGPKYCSKLIDRPYRGTQLKAKQLGLRYNQSLKYNYDDLNKIVKESNNKSECIRKLGLSPKSAGNFDTLNRYINEYDLDITHFENKHDSMVNYVKQNRKELCEILIKNSKYSNRFRLKERLYNEGLKERICEKCGQDEYWNGEKMSLILDHINGINNDNRIENLRILCPNCNGTLETHCRGKNKLNKHKKNEEKIKCKECPNLVHKRNKTGLCVDCSSKKQRKVERPIYETLVKDIEELGYVGTGKKYGVSDNAIRKWKKFYEK